MQLTAFPTRHARQAAQHLRKRRASLVSAQRGRKPQANIVEERRAKTYQLQGDEAAGMLVEYVRRAAQESLSGRLECGIKPVFGNEDGSRRDDGAVSFHANGA